MEAEAVASDDFVEQRLPAILAFAAGRDSNEAGFGEPLVVAIQSTAPFRGGNPRRDARGLRPAKSQGEWTECHGARGPGTGAATLQAETMGSRAGRDRTRPPFHLHDRQAEFAGAVH